MMFPQIRCYHAGMQSQPNVFYLLCKGENAGKPSLPLGGSLIRERTKFGGGSPWTNSFVVICPNGQYFDFYFWLLWALFKSNSFKIHLRGSAVPFINLDDVRSVIKELAPAIYPDWSKFQELIITMDKLEKLKTNLSQQIIASENLQSFLIRSYFNTVIKKSPW